MKSSQHITRKSNPSVVPRQGAWQCDAGSMSFISLRNHVLKLILKFIWKYKESNGKTVLKEQKRISTPTYIVHKTVNSKWIIDRNRDK